MTTAKNKVYNKVAKPPSTYLLSKHRFKFLLFGYLDNKMYIDVKETIKKYFLVRMMREACGMRYPWNPF